MKTYKDSDIIEIAEQILNKGSKPCPLNVYPAVKRKFKKATRLEVSEDFKRLVAGGKIKLSFSYAVKSWRAETVTKSGGLFGDGFGLGLSMA
ncbi:hypothetical protein [Photobacterium damselae]|uniref:hypothetical protein n=1 Tax=Photobacterium damselae TaxID=38293 RepID=UPI00406819A3